MMRVTEHELSSSVLGSILSFVDDSERPVHASVLE